MPKRRKKRRFSEFDDVTDAQLDSCLEISSQFRNSVEHVPKVPTVKPSKTARKRKKKQTTLGEAFGSVRPIVDATIQPAVTPPPEAPASLSCIEGMMEQKDINFHYDQSEKLKAQIMKYQRDPGQPWLALVVGPAGCGKSFTVKQALQDFKVHHIDMLYDNFNQHMKDAIYPSYNLRGPTVPAVAVIENVDTLPVNEFERIFRFLKEANNIQSGGGKKRKRKIRQGRITNFVVMTCINKFVAHVWKMVKPNTFLAKKLKAVTIEVKALDYSQHMCIGRRICTLRNLPTPQSSHFVKSSIQAIVRACDGDTAKFLSMMEMMCLDLAVSKQPKFEAAEQRKDFQSSVNIFTFARKLLKPPSDMGPENPGLLMSEDMPSVAHNCSFKDFVMARKRLRDATDEKEQHRRQQAEMAIYNQPQVIGPYTAMWDRGGEKMHRLVHSNYPVFSALRLKDTYYGGDHVSAIAGAYSDWDAVDYSAKTHLELGFKLTCRHTFTQVKFCEAQSSGQSTLKMGFLFNPSLPSLQAVKVGYTKGEWEKLQHLAIMEKVVNERKAQDLTRDEDPQMRKYVLNRHMNLRWTFTDQGYSKLKVEKQLTGKALSKLEKQRTGQLKVLRYFKVSKETEERLDQWLEEEQKKE